MPALKIIWGYIWRPKSIRKSKNDKPKKNKGNSKWSEYYNYIEQKNVLSVINKYNVM